MSRSAVLRRAAGLLAFAALVWVPSAAANQGYQDDPLYIGQFNTSACSHPSPTSFCTAGPNNDTTVLEVKAGFPYSGFYVHDVSSQNSTPADGFTITGESEEGVALFGLAHADKAAIAAYNDKTGVGVEARSHLNDGVFGTTQALGRSGVYGLNDGGGGWGVVGRSNADQKAGVWGDNVSTSNGGNNGVFGSSHGSLASGVYGENLAGGFGVAGRANGTRAAVLGDNTGAGDGIEAVAVASGKSAIFAHHIHANNGWGVFGLSENGTGIYGQGTANGVEGKSVGAAGAGVLAQNTGGGPALVAVGPSTLAGKINAPARSGKVVVPAGSATVTKTGVPLTAQSLVMATVQQNVPGIYLRAAVPNPAASSFTIYLSGNAPTATTIAWFVVN